MALSPYSFTPAKGSGVNRLVGELAARRRAAFTGAVGDADDLVIRGLELGVGDAHFQNGTGLIPQLHKVPGFEGTGGEERDAADHIGEGSLDCQGQGQRDDA